MDLITTRSRELLDNKGPLSHGFYTSGQLMLEEYYTLAVIGKAGIGTPHMDGNTRLCTATAAASLKEAFGADGQPGSYADLDVCQALFCFGHNLAATQTVLWSRILDRLAGPDSYAWSQSIHERGRLRRRPRSIWRRGLVPTSRWSTACCSS
ncbi:MAG TPA: hypothetical protein VJ820_03605 [Propionibacteriaceae bacterium]|nr:hypothetical protein [Propionibacteriaceae bacterium]